MNKIADGTIPNPETATKFINPVEGIITSPFGGRYNPVTGNYEGHTGIDIAVSEGTEVIAVADGVVTEIGNDEFLGNHVIYETEGYRVLYAHLEKVKCKIGDKIKRGQTVALSGNTGRSTGPHLHYTVWEEGELLDPIALVELPISEEARQELYKE